MYNKYGRDISNEELIVYFRNLIGSCFKLMPMKEKKDPNYEIYLNKLLFQICGCEDLIFYSNELIKIIFNLEGLVKIIDKPIDIKIHNSIVKENITLCNQIIGELKGGVESE